MKAGIVALCDFFFIYRVVVAVYTGRKKPDNHKLKELKKKSGNIKERTTSASFPIAIMFSIPTTMNSTEQNILFLLHPLFKIINV